MNIQNQILDSIDIIVKKALENQQNTETVPSIVEGIANDKYVVTVNGTKCEVYDSVGCNPSIGKSVWVQIPNGDIKGAFITGLRGNAEGSGGGGGSIRNQADWYETNVNSPSFIRNKYITVNMPTTRSNIKTNESFNIAFGKIARYLEDLSDLAFKNKISTSDIENLDSVLSKPITDDMIHSLFK